MEVKCVASVTVLLVVVVTYGEAVKCYLGNPDFPEYLLQTDCAGSCMTSEVVINGVKQVGVMCWNTKSIDTCIETTDAKICYCNTDLCNDGSSQNFGGEVLKCNVGVEGSSVTEQNCAGSCVTTETTTNGEKSVAFSCLPNRIVAFCYEETDTLTCYCNTDHCNRGDSQRGSGETLRCHVDIGYEYLTKTDCAGSCYTYEYTRKGKKVDSAGCWLQKMNNTCDEGYLEKRCYCNTNLCNTLGSSDENNGGNSNPSPSGGENGWDYSNPASSGDGIDGGFNFNPSASVGTALKVTWMVTCLVVIAAAVGNVAI